MRIDLQVDDAQLKRLVGQSPKRLAYAAVNAILDTALLAQETVREHVISEFELRKPGFVLRQAAIIKPFPSVKDARPFAEISVGQKPRLLLSQFERGGERKPFVGKHVAVPVTGGAARPSIGSPVKKEFRFTQLGLRPMKSRDERSRERRRKRKGITLAQPDTRSRVLRGKQRTYFIPGVGVFRRVDSKTTKLVYLLATRDVDLDDDLDFVATVTRIANRWLPEYLSIGINEALAARRR